jgi:hypothetical protein
MTVAFFQHRTNRPTLILGSVPINSQILLLSFRIEVFVHLMNDMLISPSLEGYHLAKVIETFTDGEI